MPRPTKPYPLHVAVLGAGPIGIEAALHLRQAGHHVTVYERGQVGEHLLRWGHVRMFTPFGSNSSTLGRATLADAHPDLPGPHELLTGHDFRNRYLLPLTQSKDLADCVQTQTEVLGRLAPRRRRVSPAAASGTGVARSGRGGRRLYRGLRPAESAGAGGLGGAR
jgi:glycine/D-amino acid oxidase-like deaminating enzyme